MDKETANHYVPLMITYNFKVQVFWNVTPCQVVDSYHCSKETQCLHPKSQAVTTVFIG